MKKFYKSVRYIKSADDYTVLLDEKPARTPLGAPFNIANERLAKCICDEWRAQGENIVKETMPLSQIVTVALDLEAKKRAALCADLLRYSETDLVCYRAGDIPDLKTIQAQLDPVIAWSEERFGIGLILTDGIMPVKQPLGNKEKFAAVLNAYDDWRLAALAVVVKPLSSLVLALALVEVHLSAKSAFHLSHLEEIYETEKWGRDEEKDARLLKLENEIRNVEKYLALL